MSGSFDALFDEFRSTAFRLEQRRSYNVGGQEAVRIEAFETHRARPDRSVRTDPWLTRIAVTTAAGKQWRRVRVVDHPLTAYQRYQMLAGSYVENQTAGDETLVIARGHAEPWLRYGPVDALLGDFWLFDHGLPTQLAVALDYTDDGQWLGFRFIVDPVELDAALFAAVELARHALPLAEFLASQERSVA